MTRTSTALRRLGVVGVVAMTIGAGVPAFFATSASANHVSSVTLSPDQQAAQPGTCAPFTANVAAGTSPASATVVDVQIEQSVTRSNSATPTAALQIEFCTPPASSGANVQGPGSTGFGGTTTTDVNGNINSGPNGTGVCPTGAPVNNAAGTETTTTARCTAEFVVDASGNVTFGVRSNTVGQVQVTAFAEEPNAGGGTAGNRTGNNTPNVGELQDTSTLFVVVSGQNAVRTVDCEPETGQGPAGGAVTFTCTVTGTATSGGSLPISGAQLSYIVTSGPDANQTPQNCGNFDTNAGAAGNPNATTDQNGRQTCRVLNGGTPGTDNVLIFAEQNGAAGPQTEEPSDAVVAVFAGAARTIDCEPETATGGVGTEQFVECTVRDVNNTTVSGQQVSFSVTGAAARITNQECFTASNNDRCVLTTNASGLVRLFVRSDQNGTATITGSLFNPNTNTLASNDPGAECRQAAGQTTQPGVNATGRSAGVCADSVERIFGNVAASPTTAPTGSPTTAPTTAPTGSPNNTQSPGQAPGCAVVAQVRLERTTITATGSTGVTVTTTPNSVVDLIAYSRPSTTFRVVRSAEVGADGVAEFRIVPPTNTRLFAQQRGCAAGPQVVLNVRTQLSLNVVRNGTRNYTFSGRALPARNGGLIVSLYRVTNDGRQILTAQTRANAATGTYTITRQFTGSGRFGFVVRTGQDLQNAPGASNVRSLAVF